jgi:hypothetical protein
MAPARPYVETAHGRSKVRPSTWAQKWTVSCAQDHPPERLQPRSSGWSPARLLGRQREDR